MHLIEQETYLFRAACSELRTEIVNLRRSSTSKQKSGLAHLQHTFDILSQRTTSELAALRDELKGMLNDRRMDNQSSKQALDSAITELNYMISTSISSDAKSEIEGLRWVLTRRAAMTVGSMVVMLLLSLQYSRYTMHERAAEEKRKEGHNTVSVGAFTERRGTSEAGTQTEVSATGGGSKTGRKEGDVGFVSLG